MTDPLLALISYVVMTCAVAVIFRLMGMRHYIAGAVTLAVVMAMVIYVLIVT